MIQTEDLTKRFTKSKKEAPITAVDGLTLNVEIGRAHV